MLPERKNRSSSKANLIFSVVFHGALIVIVFVLAAKTGIIPPRYIPISLIKPEEKKPEPPKPEPPKPETPKEVEQPKVNVPPPQVAAVAPPPVNDTPAVAPAAAVISGMDYPEGKAVTEMSDPRSIYKALVEHILQTRWNRPDDMDDAKFSADVELTIDSKGNIKNYRWISGSGNTRWDNSVKEVLAEVKTISRTPPKNFPEKFVTRFDVESVRSEAVQLSSR
jgi:hypothetical protein